MIRYRHIATVFALALGLALGGCSGESDINRSPVAADDPERFDRAKQQAEEAEAASTQAEKAVFRCAAGPEPSP